MTSNRQTDDLGQVAGWTRKAENGVIRSSLGDTDAGSVLLAGEDYEPNPTCSNTLITTGE